MKLLYQYADLKELGIPYSEEHLRQLVKQGEFPAPIKCSGGGRNARKSWVPEEVHKYVEKRIAARDAAHGEAA